MYDWVCELYYTNWSYSLVDEEWNKIHSQFTSELNIDCILMQGLIQYDIMDAKYWCTKIILIFIHISQGLEHSLYSLLYMRLEIRVVFT